MLGKDGVFDQYILKYLVKLYHVKLRDITYVTNRFFDFFFIWACREFNFRKKSEKKSLERFAVLGIFAGSAVFLKKKFFRFFQKTVDL